MSDVPASLAPTGWYPDPGGARQWRIWNGREWTDRTRPYAVEPRPLVERLGALTAHDALARYGAPCYFAGAGLAIDVAHHVTNANSTNLAVTFQVVWTAVALGLLAVGHVAFTRAGASLRGRPTMLAAVPGLNVVMWTKWASETTSYVLPLPLTTAPATSRTESVYSAWLSQGVLLAALVAVGATRAHHDGVLNVALHCLPGLAALVSVRLAQLVRDDLLG